MLSLLIFGSSTLQDFAFAMLIGIASGTYSSIFIASPVLTAWKEREPQYIRRRQRIAEVEGGLVPAFADDVQVAMLAKDDEAEEEVAPEELERTTSKRKRRGGAVALTQPGRGKFLPDYIRVSYGRENENQTFCKELAQVLQAKACRARASLSDVSA